MSPEEKNTGFRQFSSPACSMHEADDAYMGYAGRDELLGFLTELLEAERAGAHVCLESAHEAGEGARAQLMRAVQRDEGRWVAMLASHLKTLGVEPSDKVGAFHAKVMALTDWKQRMALLNRGQGWVVRKLREMLPRVRDERLQTDLTEMLQSHEINIARLNEAEGLTP